MKIPGMSFSWKRALGVSKIKQNISRATGIPMTRSGLEKKIGKANTVALIDRVANMDITFKKYPKDEEFFTELYKEIINELEK